MHISEIHIRDPFIVRDEDSCYLFGTIGKACWGGKAEGFNVYKSCGDLENFEGPFPAFRPPENFWSETQFWAPEVHQFNGCWYIFASFLVTGGRRGTAILKSTGKVEGPYVPWSDGPVTPKEWECLDGTLYIDKDGKPWMVFCHEWLQTIDGEVCLMPLAEDFKTSAGKASLLFRASDAPWAAMNKDYRHSGYVTDGPFVYTAKNGNLLMLWSSFGSNGNYCIGLAVSESGNIFGPWKQQKAPLYSTDGGHGMIFKNRDGRIFLAIHRPNNSPNERPVFLEMHEEGGLIFPVER